MPTRLTVNGTSKVIDADGDTPLLWVLRDLVGLCGTKFGCGAGLCGACTVHIDGKSARSCITSLESVSGSRLTTIEGLADQRIGRALQEAWISLAVVQCGYCQSGQLMSAAALLATNSNPSDADIDAAMQGNVCRCGTYTRIRAGIKLAARSMTTGKATA